MDIWAVGRYDLSLSESEFWSLTPRQYHALTMRCDHRKRHHELMAGIVTAATVNYSSVYKAMWQSSQEPKMTMPEDFMPSEWAKQATQTPKRKSNKVSNSERQRVDSTIRAFFAPAIKAAQKEKRSCPQT